MKQPRHLYCCHGQVTTEYALFGALIALLAIPAVILLGGNLNNLFGGMLAKDRASIAATAPNLAAVGNEPTAKTAGMPAADFSNEPSLPGQVRFTLGNGKTLSLSGYPRELSKSVATAGANGTTGILASTIEQAAKQLLDAGSIDKSQYNSLIALANQGHRIGSIEKALEDVAASFKPGQSVLQTRLTIDGKTRIVDDLIETIGYNTGEDDLTTDINPMSDTRANAETGKLLKLYQASLSNGSLNDPNARQLVSGLVSQIAYLAEVATDTVRGLDTGEAKASNFLDVMASQTTHADSMGICATGNARDSGVTCSG